MPPPVFSATDYLWQTQRLLPRGRVWSRGWGTIAAQYLLTLMPSWVRLNARAANLVTDAFPCAPLELLPEWEASLGLPGLCTGPLPTLQQRQLAVCSKFTVRGGQSVHYFQGLAATLGYPIRIQQFAPFRCGRNRCSQPLFSEKWAYVWRVLGPPVTTVYFRAGRSTAGEPLRTWGNELLECAFEFAKPAHTHIIFAYEQESIWDEGDSIWDAGQSRWDHFYQVEEVHPTEMLRVRLPVPLRGAFLSRATSERIRPERLFAMMWEWFTRRDDE